MANRGPHACRISTHPTVSVQSDKERLAEKALPVVLPDRRMLPRALNGNSFAGPMFCGAIALMLSADPDLLPWDLREIITSTATDVAAPGADHETGHGLINCYRAVKEVLRRKAIREGADPAPYTGRTEGDVLDVKSLRKRLGKPRPTVAAAQPNSPAAKLGIRAGDRLLKFNDQEIRDPAQLRQIRTAAAKQAEEHTLTIGRDGKQLELKVGNGTLGVRLAMEFDEPVFQ